MREVQFSFMNENSQSLINILDDESSKRYYIYLHKASTNNTKTFTNVRIFKNSSSKQLGQNIEKRIYKKSGVSI
jgi:hypothetical protein